MPKLLIVDDDAATVDAFSLTLRLAGYEVATALNTQAGIREATRSWPDAVVIDLHMPVFDGLAFLRLLRLVDVGSRTPVAIITADYAVDEAVAQELRALGADLYFKPIWGEDLLDLADRLLQRAR